MNGFRPVEYHDGIEENNQNNDEIDWINFASFDHYDDDCKSWIPMVGFYFLKG